MSLPAESYLFVSTLSVPSQECIKLFQQNRINIDIIRLDSEESRETAKSGQKFFIDSVPSLILIYPNGNLQLLKGAIKIAQWIRYILSLRAPPQQPPPVIESIQPSSSSTTYPYTIPVSQTNTLQAPLEFSLPADKSKIDHKPPKKKKNVHINEEQNETIFIGSPDEPVVSLIVPSKNDGNSKISDIAKKMAEERKQQLGF